MFCTRSLKAVAQRAVVPRVLAGPKTEGPSFVNSLPLWHRALPHSYSTTAPHVNATCADSLSLLLAGTGVVAAVGAALYFRKKSEIPTVVFVLGGPGAGKGTQCEKIINNFAGWGHVSAGDCLRAERNRPDSKYGKLINDIIKEGKIVPSEITVKLLQQAMATAEGKTKFLVDGFPRNLENLTTWETVVGSSAKVVSVFYFDTDEATMEDRLLERGKTSGRSDDNKEAIKKRFKTYQNETMPIIEKYKQQGLVDRFDASLPIDEVWKQVQAKVKTI